MMILTECQNAAVQHPSFMSTKKWVFVLINEEPNIDLTSEETSCIREYNYEWIAVFLRIPSSGDGNILLKYMGFCIPGSEGATKQRDGPMGRIPAGPSRPAKSLPWGARLLLEVRGGKQNLDVNIVLLETCINMC